MKKKIIHYFSILFISLYCFFSFSCENSTESKIISISDAEKIVFRDALNSNDSGKVVYELPQIVKAGSVIKCRQVDSTDFYVSSDSWFFFIDDQPTYRWVHQCRYVFIDVSTQKLTKYDWTFYPTCLSEMKIVVF